MQTIKDGREPNAIDILAKTKKLKSGAWVNERSCNINDKYYETLEEARAHAVKEGACSSSQGPLTYVDENAHYLNIVGGKNKKGNVYGLGAVGDHYLASSSYQPSHQAVPPAYSPEEIQQMNDTITRLNVEMAATTGQLQCIIEHFGLQPPPLAPVEPPTPPPSPAIEDAMDVDGTDDVDNYLAEDEDDYLGDP